MRAGPKPAVSSEPLDLSTLPAPGWKRVDAFAREFLRVPKGTGAKEPFRLRPWQREIVRRLYPTRGARPRQGVLTMGRGNGKSALAAVLGLYALFADETEGAQVLIAASDERQARIILGAARRMVELEPRLAERCQVFQDRLFLPQTDSTLTALPADPGALQGWDPTLAIVDELAVVTRDEEVWSAMALAAGKRAQSLCLAISTPGDSADSQLWRLVEYGREHPEDRSFVLVEYGAPDGCDVADEGAWKAGNPALHDFLAVDAMRATLATTREAPFRRFRLAQWASGTNSWLEFGRWAELADPSRVVGSADRVVLAFDGSASGDSTALVGATVEACPHVFVIGLWQNPGDPRWRVPRGEVDAAVDAAFARYDVAELACDPWGWRSEIESWGARYESVLEWPTNVISRMAPATDRAYQLVAAGSLTHDGDSRLAAHVANAVAKSTPHGDVIVKARRADPRKIDAAVAAIVAVDRAAFHAGKTKKRRRMVVR